MNWLTIVETAAAVYLIGGALAINAGDNWQSKLVFKVLPMLIGLPLAFGVFAKMRGWPI